MMRRRSPAPGVVLPRPLLVRFTMLSSLYARRGRTGRPPKSAVSSTLLLFITINWPESPRIHAGDEWLLVVAEPMCSTACGPVALCQPNRVGGFRDTSFSRVQALAYWDEGALRWRMSRCCTAALRWSHRPFRAGQALAGSDHVGCRDDLRISRIYPGRVSNFLLRAHVRT